MGTSRRLMLPKRLRLRRVTCGGIGSLNTACGVWLPRALPSAGASCAKVSVELCSEETVLRPRQGNKARVKSSRQAYCDEEAVLHSARTSFTLSVPRESPPSFESDLVKLEWELRFAFDVLTGPSGAKGQLNWKLPVRLSLKH